MKESEILEAIERLKNGEFIRLWDKENKLAICILLRAFEDNRGFSLDYINAYRSNLPSIQPGSNDQVHVGMAMHATNKKFCYLILSLRSDEKPNMPGYIEITDTEVDRLTDV